MSKVFANISDGKVINTIVGDNFDSVAEMLGAENIVLVTEETGNPEINGAWDGTIFHPAPAVEPVVEEPVVTE